MRKYIYIFKFEIMNSLQYVFNILSRIIGYFIMIYIFVNLWNYIYSDPNELINNYSMNQMIWYVIFTELLWFIVGGRKFCSQITADVKGGNIAYNMNKPYSYIGYWVSAHLGESVLKTIIFTAVSMIMGIILVGNIPAHDFGSILAIILVSVIAMIINTLFIIFIGLFSFIIEDSGPFYWLYSKMILVFGTLFPIEFFPIFLQGILKYSPVYVLTYGPARLFVQFSLDEFIRLLIAQIIYVVIAYTMCLLVYKKGVRKLNVNGG